METRGASISIHELLGRLDRAGKCLPTGGLSITPTVLVSQGKTVKPAFRSIDYWTVWTRLENTYRRVGQDHTDGIGKSRENGEDSISLH